MSTDSLPEEEIPLASDVIQKLIGTSHHLQRVFEMRLASLDIPIRTSGPRLRLLLAVANSPKLRMSELASQLGIKARTVTDFVDALEQESLLIRIPDPLDRRATLLDLTPTAKEHIERVSSLQSDLSEQIISRLSGAQRFELLELLQILVNENSECSLVE